MFSLGNKNKKKSLDCLRVKTLYFSDNSTAVFKSIFAIAGSVIADKWCWVAEEEESDLILVNIDHEDGRFFMQINAHNRDCVAHGYNANKQYAGALNKPLLSSAVIDLFDGYASGRLSESTNKVIHLGLTRWLSFDETAGYSRLDQVAMIIARFQPSFTELMEKTALSEPVLRKLVLRLKEMGCISLLSGGERGYRDDLVDRRMATKPVEKDRRGAESSTPLVEKTT